MTVTTQWQENDKASRAKKRKESASDPEQNVTGSYLNALQRYPQLAHEDLVELFKQYNAGVVREKNEVISRTPEAELIRKKLTECNLRLVVSIAKQYRSHNLDLIDLIQEGNFGLMKAVDRFKWEKGFRFSTYATWWIKQAIGQHVLKRKRTIRLPAHAATVQRRMMQAIEDHKDATGNEPSDEELRKLVGASKTVIKATQHAGRGTISLQQPLSSSGEGDTLEDKVEDQRPGSSPFDNVAEKQLIEIVHSVLLTLSAKEQAILRLRFGLVEDDTNSTEYPITEAEMKSVMEGKGLQ